MEGNGPPPSATADTAETIVSYSLIDALDEEGRFSTFLEVLEAAEVTEALDETGPFTLFAPTDQAFDALPEDTLDAWLEPPDQGKLEGVVMNHLVPGEISSLTLENQTALTTMIGRPIPVSMRNDTLWIGHAAIVRADVGATNGVIHVIDHVLDPLHLYTH